MAISPVLDQLNLIVDDMDRSVDFYRAIGLDIPDEAVWRTETGGHHVENEMPGGFELALDSKLLAGVYNAGWRPFKGEGNRTIMSFRYRDAAEVDATYERVTALGYGSSQRPYYTFWGSRFAIVADPDGNHVGLMSPPDPAHRGQPPKI